MATVLKRREVKVARVPHGEIWVMPKVVAWWPALTVALLAAQAANVLDFVSTWIGVVHYHAVEIGPIMKPFMAAVGLVGGLVIGKAAAGALVFAVGAAGRAGIGGWRVRPERRGLVLWSLWAITVLLGYGAAHNFSGAWVLYRLRGW